MKIYQNRFYMRDSRCILDEGEGGASTFDGKSLWNGEGEVKDKKDTRKHHEKSSKSLS